MTAAGITALDTDTYNGSGTRSVLLAAVHTWWRGHYLSGKSAYLE
jgi:hypothetical protein